MKEQQDPIKEGPGPIKNSQSQPSFGNYDLIRRIDVGGMGEVYLARQRTAFGREVALKIIRSDLVHDVTARKRFLREAEVSAHLKHEHILPLVEFGEEQGRLFLVTPYIENGTLARRLQSGPLSFSEVYQLFSALVQAIAYIHKRGVIHRDLKPNNVLLDRGQDSDQVYVRLIDFGIATIQGMTASAPLTMAGGEVGTVAYLAPERLDGIAAASNDIYSLGIMLYQMLTGQLPVTGKLLPLPAPLDAVVRYCIAPRPQDRFATADELLKAFEDAYRSLQAQGPAIMPAPSSALRPEGMPAPPRHLTTPPPVGNPPLQEHRSLSSADTPSRPGFSFQSGDYSAPTAFLKSNRGTGKYGQGSNSTVIVKTSPRFRQTKRRNSLISIISLSIIIVLLIIVGVALFAFQSVVSANIAISPQVRPISSVLTMTAKPGITVVDTGSASLPMNVLSSSKTLPETGQTTGRPLICLPLICHRMVSSDDVSRLELQAKQALITQLTQDLNARLQAMDATAVSKPDFVDANVSVQPQVGDTSDTVTVTLTEQGGMQYVANKDAQTLARTLLQQQVQRQFGSNYLLLNQLTKIGQPVVQSINNDDTVTIAIAAGGVVQYQISSAQRSEIQNQIKGMKLGAAHDFIAKQTGIDANTIVVHVTYGDTIPTSVQQIRIVTLNPANLPSVQLPPLKSSITTI